VRAIGDLRDAVPVAAPRVVVNRLRGSVVPGNARSEIAGALERFAGIDTATFLPDDPHAADAALAAGRTLADVAPRSRLRLALRDLAADLAGAQVPPRGRRRR
ncbi:MAG: chromosome partitioning protein, partial [Actinomycetota bacterium]|nr:chromosome partitioning protein [Actinomycetota bacterium]